MWDKKQLTQLIHEKLKDTKFIVVANRQPYKHILREGAPFCVKPTGGVVSALDPVMRVCKGTWVAFGDGEADKQVAKKDGTLAVPPDHPSYTLKRIWLNHKEVDGYYYGFSNEVLWPLCHVVYQRPSFNPDDWDLYVKVNKKFADAVLEEIKDEDAFIFVQDYHLALFSKYIKEKRPDVPIAQFWHIPWPNPEAFRICPQAKEILEGLLSNDLFALHIRQHCNHFIDTVRELMEVRVDMERFSIFKDEHETLVRDIPISVDFEEISERASKPEIDNLIKDMKNKYNVKTEYLLGGLERLDYTKGIPERLIGYGRFLEKYPEYRGKVTYLQAGELSRTHIEKYRQLNKEIDSIIDEINWKYAQDSWTPIVMIRDFLNPKQILALFRMCNGFIVSSLHDGMNLVAKEFVASRSDEKGTLILSKFTGSSRELDQSLHVNPYDQDEMAKVIKKALKMPAKEQTRRMRKLRGTVKENNIYKWIGTVISNLANL